MWRFKPSKYKNATPKVPKKGEGWILDISVQSPHSYGNHIKASAAFMAFNVDSPGGGNLGILPIDDNGRKSRNLPVLHAHSGLAKDFDFSPFDDGLLATCSEDHSIKLWRIHESGLPFKNETNFQSPSHEVEIVLWHPTVDCLLTASSNKYIKIWDVTKQEEIYSNSKHDDIVQSFSWRSDGSMLVSSGKDGILQIWDPRNSDTIQETKGHLKTRDSRVIWLGDSEYILSTGFGATKEKEVSLRDVRNFNKILFVSSLESSLNVFIPLFDPDTNMLFLVSKGETVLHFWEVTYKEPFFQEGTRYVGDVQAKGAALVPKRALNVMQAEVNKILLLGKDCIVPITYQVPRKSYMDYHTDLYPDTRGTEPAVSLEDWSKGNNKKINTISLDPQKIPNCGLVKFGHVFNSLKHPESIGISNENKNNSFVSESSKEKEIGFDSESLNVEMKTEYEVEKFISNKDKPAVPPKPARHNKISSESQVTDFISQEKVKNVQVVVECELVNSRLQKDSYLSRTKENIRNLEQCRGDKNVLPAAPSPHRTPRTFVKVAKFRHLNGNIHHKNTHITNIINLNKTISGECDGFHANIERVAFPLSTAGGHIAVLELNKPGRLPSNNLPNVVCGSTIMDFCWDPFDPHRLVLGSENGKIHVCHIPEDGLQDECPPNETWDAHGDKISIIKFHPLAKDVITTASYDLTVKVWDLTNQEMKITLEGHTDQIFSIAWSPDGKYLATVSKDQRLRIYEPRCSSTPIQEGPGPSGKRGARILWVFGGSHLIVSGFSKVSERQISLYSVNDISEPLATEGINVNPSILIPFYDDDSSTLFVTGKGESTIFAYEVSLDSPYFYPLSHYKCSGPHQAVSFLSKHICNVIEVEFARAIRLTNTSIEPLSFTVPRLRAEYFQDDLFPDTRITWEPGCSSWEWFSGKNVKPKFISLKPEGMILLSEAPQKLPSSPAPVQIEKQIQYEGQMVLESSLAFLSGGKEKQEQIISSMKDKMSFQDDKLPQDSFEGVDPDEWDEDRNP